MLGKFLEVLYKCLWSQHCKLISNLPATEKCLNPSATVTAVAGPRIVWNRLSYGGVNEKD